MGIPFLDGDKLSRFQIQNILITAKELTRTGISFVEALELMSEDTSNPKKVQDKLKAVVNDIKVKGRKAEDVLWFHKIVGYLEYVILQYSTDIRESIEDILEMKSKSNLFEGMVISIFAMPLGLILGALGIMYLAQPKIYEFIAFMDEMAQAFGKGSPLKNMVLPFYVESQEATLMVIGAIIGVVAGIIILYKAIYHRNASLIYKMFPLKTYDDAYFLFSMMSKLSKAGVSTQKIVDEVYSFVQPESLKPMLSEMKRYIENNQKFYLVLERYGFPSDITSMVATGEKTENLWENINSLIGYVQNAREEKTKMYKNLIAPPLKMAGFAAVIALFISVFLLMITMSMELSSV